ncbi:Dimerisation domain-containing protein [Pseudomonas asturiensis]|uniref:Dimerisation domain-containing protein n=1 Tax=Pseudomonas asturiensis TaxID=1190415 RepID=A0A1M7J638_9PSED|nr:methyltransferase [Pseudomonas asturiensis]SHM48361.1 Dimerisation domain-containing protein [Pseudomonas asturiensis]
MLNQGTIDFRGTLPSSEALVHTLVNGYMLSASLFGCVEVDLFSHLDETSGTAISELADACLLSAAHVQKLVSFGLSVGLIIQRDDQFFNSSDAQKLLSRHSAHNICSAVEHHRRHVYPLFGHLAESLKSGKPISDRLHLSSVQGDTHEFYAELDKSESDFAVFMAAMNTFSTGAGTRIADTLGARIGSAAPLRILDLGGGGGQVSIEIAQAIPQAQITLIDLEKATRFARAEVDRKGLGNRISCLPGDIFARLPLAEAGFDVVLISAVLGDWSHDYQVKLLANAYHYLKSGGCLVVSETLLDDDLAGPILPTLMSLYVQILTEGGHNFTAKSLVALLAGNRFEHIEVQLNRAHGCRDTVLASKTS